MDTVFYHNFPKAKGNNEIVLCNVLGRSNVVILFAMDKHTHLLLTEHFPTARFFSTASPLTEYFARKSRLGNSRKLYTHIREQQMEVFCFDKHLTGKLEDKEELLKELRNYLRQVFVINPKAEFNRSEISKIEEIPFDMQTLLLCE